ncbi:hypothetical protein QYM36_004830 [Artemia franciscana]|uniref:HTH psq-type domain-containing protein n=1 Tax=Artemia franciscana TaxID=6661 RepID=A0AA88LAL4_ARTSF|nr:hypothetical protein QYM36_004830 [Artemia franciscana]
MNNAVDSVISGRCSCLKASDEFEVPQTTLERKKKNPEYLIDETAGKFQAVFVQEQELELETYLKTMEVRLFGRTMKVLRTLAYQLSQRNGIDHRFQSEIAGPDLANGFLREILLGLFVSPS